MPGAKGIISENSIAGRELGKRIIERGDEG
jgi:hypothetical protein